jgi:hypothetical protein
MKLHINPDAMTIGDLEDFEEITGKPFDKVLAGTVARDDETGDILKDDRGRPIREVSMRAVDLKALIFVTQRAINPEFTIEDARKVRVTDLSIESDDEGVDAEGKGVSAPDA